MSLFASARVGMFEKKIISFFLTNQNLNLMKRFICKQHDKMITIVK
jgi:hypothetical protein